jgi:hypothetical protein
MSAVTNCSSDLSPYLTKHYLLGEVYWRAWKASGGEFRERLETGCIQDYMDGGMRAHRGYARPVSDFCNHCTGVTRSPEIRVPRY